MAEAAQALDLRKENLRRMVQDFGFYARHCLKILPKEGGLPVPFEMNKAQRYVHERLEQQLAEKGRVRALILKYRQGGISTYIQGRFRWKIKHRRGKKAYVVAHEQAASDNMFKMAKRYHDNEPPDVRPSIGASNAKEIWFNKLDSRYEVATAGTMEIGRSGTAQYVHCSEYAFWKNAETHWAGIGQVVPSGAEGAATEIIVETTGNGINNDFHHRWNRAVAGKGEFIAIFIGWFLDDGYRMPVPQDWSRSDEEEELAALYDLDDEQLAWRRNKIESEFKGDVERFHQEYPSCPQEAFMSDKRNLVIPVARALQAQKNHLDKGVGAVVAGLDPARMGDDSTAVVVRQGRKVLAHKTYEHHDTMEVAGIAVRLLTTNPNIRMLFVDMIGIGAGVVDRLHELGYESRVMGVNFANKAADEDRHINKRSECWGEMAEWMKYADLPEGEAWLADVTSTAIERYDSRGRPKLETKEQVKKLLGKSPDLADALAMTFSEPVLLAPRSRAPVTGHVPVDDLTGY